MVIIRFGLYSFGIFQLQHSEFHFEERSHVCILNFFHDYFTCNVRTISQLWRYFFGVLNPNTICTSRHAAIGRWWWHLFHWININWSDYFFHAIGKAFFVTFASVGFVVDIAEPSVLLFASFGPFDVERSWERRMAWVQIVRLLIASFSNPFG